MKSKYTKIICIIGYFLAANLLTAQSPCIVYNANDYKGTAYPLNKGAEVILKTTDGISFKINDTNAALKVKRIEPYNGVNGGSAPYTNLFFYAEQDQPFMTNEVPNGQFKDVQMIASCITKQSVPEPDIYIPIDGNKIPSDKRRHVTPSGSKTLMLKRAFIWENAEQLDAPCPEAHGPFAAVGIGVFKPKILDYDFERLNIQKNSFPLTSRCGVDSLLYTTDPVYRKSVHDNPCNFTCFSGENCMGNLHIEGTGANLYGPIFHAVTPNCEIDLGWFGSIDFGAPPDAYNEWIDGPWGCVYSNVGLLNWDDIQEDEVVVAGNEGDQFHDYLVVSIGSLDDFMGGGIIKRDMEGEFLINLGAHGWIVVENKKFVPTESVELTSHYWYPTWDGSYPEAACGPLSLLEVQETYGSFCHKEGQTYTVKYPHLINKTTGDSIRMPDSIVVATSEFTNDTLHYLDYLLEYNFSSLKYNGRDTFINILEQDFRNRGSQYNPYTTSGQVENFVPTGDSVGVYSYIPPDNYLTKELTYLPIDPELKYHQDSILTGKSKAESFPNHNNVRQTPVVFNGSPKKNYTSATNSFSLHPNPSTSSIQLQYNFLESTKANIFLVNAIGQRVKALLLNENIPKGAFSQSFTLDALPPGIYYCVLETSEERKVQKLVIAR